MITHTHTTDCSCTTFDIHSRHL